MCAAGTLATTIDPDHKSEAEVNSTAVKFRTRAPGDRLRLSEQVCDCRVDFLSQADCLTRCW